MGLTITYMNKQMNISNYLDIVTNIILSNAKNIHKENLNFIDGRYQGLLTIERGIQNIFKVVDKKSSISDKFKNLKVYQVNNDEKIISEINKFFKKVNNLQTEFIIKIEDYYIENINKKGKICRMNILEEFYEYISLREYLGFFYDDYISGNLKMTIEHLFEELIKLSNLILDHINIMHENEIRKFNMNLNNIMFCKLRNGYGIKFTDIESAEIYRINCREESAKLNDYENINNDDYHNFLIILFQLVFFIKNLSLKSIFDYTDMYEFYKTDIRIIQKELLEIFSSDIKLTYFKYLIIYLTERSFEKLRELNQIYKEIFNKTINPKINSPELRLSLLFAFVEINEDEYLEYFFNILYDYKLKDDKMLINFIIENNNIQNLIMKYINFIQLHYSKNKKIDIMSIINNSINEYLFHEDISRMKVYGIFPLILAYLNNCEIDYFSILSLIKKFSLNNTGTIVNIAEKINFHYSLSKYFENCENNINDEFRDNLCRILPFLSLEYIKSLYKYLNNEQILQIIKKYPLICRKKEFYKEIIIILSSIIEKKEISESEMLLYLYSLFSLMLYKKNIKCCFIYSTCLSQTLMRDLSNNNFSEFGFYCYTCKEKTNVTTIICIICVHRCHSGHKVAPIGYQIIECTCSSSINNCNSIKPLDIPNHVKNYQIKPITIHYPSDDELNNLCKSPKLNVYISIESETCTIQGKNPLCCLTSIRDSDIILENNIEETVAYYEVEILMGGYYDQIAIGLTNNENFPLNEFVGYINDSVGYHGDDGKCYVNGNNYVYGTKFGSKDVVGCGVTKSGNIYFVHNCCILPLLDIKMRGNIFPIISLRGKYSSVRIIHDINLFKFKHKKFSTYKNPTLHLSYSHSFTKMISNNEDILQNIQSICKNYKNYIEISRKFKKYALIMHKVCKNSKKNLLKYFILSEDTSTKNSTETNKFYENEENFSKNQNIIEKVLKKPIFEPSIINRVVDKSNNVEEISNRNKIGNNSNLILSSIQNNSQSNSFIRKNNLSKCNNACGTKCIIF